METKPDDTSLMPGNDGQDCPGNPELCDECDYLICCTNYNGMCDRCLEENGRCATAPSSLHPPTPSRPPSPLAGAGST